MIQIGSLDVYNFKSIKYINGMMYLKTSSIIFFIVILHFLIPSLASLVTRCVPHWRIISPPQSQINAINMSIALRALKYYINVPCGDILAGILKYIMMAQINIYQSASLHFAKQRVLV